MAPTDGDHTLPDRIVAAPRRVVLLRGPAAAGKSSATLAFYQRHADALGSRCLLVLPTTAAVQAAKRRLLELSPTGVLVGARVWTFASLAGAILSAAERPKKAISAFAGQVMLRRIVDELVTAGGLAALRAVADTPGLIPALGRGIAELKRAAVEPEALQRAVGPARRSEGPNRLRDLLEVYRAYQQQLQASGAYDTEGLFWEARDQLAAAADAPALEGVAAIAVDGFTDFGRTQLAILEQLARRVERMLITLPVADDGRDRMWQWTRRTLSHLRRAFGDDLHEIAVEPASGKAANLPRATWDDLFDMDAPARQCPSGLAVIAAAGVEAEVSAVAARVKRLLLDGAAPGTTRASQRSAASQSSIAVVARDMDAYRPVIQRIFAQSDIPIAPAAEPLTDAPIIRFLLDASSLHPDYAYADVLRVIKNSYFRPEALGAYSAKTAATAEMIIRRGNVLGGRQAYARAAERLARAPDRAEDDDDAAVDLGPAVASRAEISQAAEMLDKLFGLAATTADLRDLADALQLHQAALSTGEAELTARDLRALETMRSAIDALGEPPPIAALRQALAAVWCPPARGESVVDVRDVLDARPMRYEHVFLVGLGEGQFPRRFADESLIRQSDRAAWAGKGLVLDHRSDLISREMLLFYLAVSRADASLTLSFQESDASGRPGAPGSFLQGLTDRVGGLTALEQGKALCRIPPGRFIPPLEEIASRQDALNAAVAGLFGRGDKDSAGILAWAADDAPESIRRVAMGLLARHRRWSPGAADEFDGRITHPALLEALRQGYGPRAVFSASQLNCYGQCPWQFFASYVLKLAPLDQPQRMLEPVSRGILCHDVLFTTFNRLREQYGSPVRLDRIEPGRLTDALERSMREHADRADLRSPPYPALWQILQRQMLSELRSYVLSQRDGGSLRRQAVHFELAFGMADRLPADRHDPASRDGPVAVATPAGKVLLRGKIDRVDLVRLGDVAGLLVVDYKTGRLPAIGEITAGQSVQLALYAAALRAWSAGPHTTRLGAECVGGVFHKIGRAGPAERWFARVKPARGELVEDDEYDNMQAQAVETVGRFVEGIRSGRFELSPEAACPSYCPFRRICQFSDVRMEAKFGHREDADD
ncbi:MAG TPA: PD-(D/E)XK nuclease family protein [Phycisphaerae bacterium]|nr:PD-(D/E)XK nuclease family protein [Phycisphaerae bacterium]